MAGKDVTAVDEKVGTLSGNTRQSSIESLKNIWHTGHEGDKNMLAQSSGCSRFCCEATTTTRPWFITTM